MLAWLLVALVSMRSELAWRERAALKEASGLVENVRQVDMGVIIRVVRADPDGLELVDGSPPMRVLREHRRGGMVERVTPATSRFVGPSRNPAIWYCSEAQEPLILHGDDLPPALGAYGSMGAGKTGALVRWLGLRVIEATGMERPRIGATAPTGERLLAIRLEVETAWPASWFDWHERLSTYRMANAARVELVQTHEQSKAEGNKIQGQNWIAAGSDELQDSIRADSDIEARGRKAPGGRYRRFATITAKDDSAWRNFSARLRSIPNVWRISKMLGPDSPFIHPDYWPRLKLTMTDREYRRKVLAEDVGPERMTYHTFTRENVRPVPKVGARHVTSLVLRVKTGDRRHALLVGCDPGAAKAGSVFLRAYELPGEPDPVWWVVGELMTRNATTEQHATKALELVRSRFGVNVSDEDEQAHVRADPYGKNRKSPDKDVYRVWSRVGFDIRAAQYNEAGTGTGQIKVDARIEMMCRLLCDASGRRRLFIDCDDRGQPVAPLLVNALESSERDERGEAEVERKDDTDLSDLPSACAYALWPWEKEAAKSVRTEVRKGIR